MNFNVLIYKANLFAQTSFRRMHKFMLWIYTLILLLEIVKIIVVIDNKDDTILCTVFFLTDHFTQFNCRNLVSLSLDAFHTSLLPVKTFLTLE